MLCYRVPHEMSLGTPFPGRFATLYGSSESPNETLGLEHRKAGAASNNQQLLPTKILPKCRQTIKIGSISLVSPYSSEKLLGASPRDALVS